MRRWLALTDDERRLTVGAALLVCAAAVGLRLAGLRRMLEWAERPSGGGALSDAGVEARLAAARRAARYVPGGTCLTESLALARMLRKKGVAANVRIGVTADRTFAAHAWVELNGAALAATDSRFAPLPVGSRR